MARAHTPIFSFAVSPRARAGVLGVALAGAVIWGTLRPARRHLAGPWVADPQRVAQARETLDPNTASLASLQRLPGIGELRAADIVAWRTAHGPRPFAGPADLDAVPNIGPGTVAKMAPYLIWSPSTEGPDE